MSVLIPPNQSGQNLPRASRQKSDGCDKSKTHTGRRGSRCHLQILSTMDCPYPDGDDDGRGGAGCERDDLRNTRNARHHESGRGPIFRKDRDTPPSSFYGKSIHHNPFDSASPTSVASLFDLPPSDRHSSLYTDNDYLQPRSVSPDSSGNGPSASNRRHGFDYNTSKTIKNRDFRASSTIAGASYERFGFPHEDTNFPKIAAFGNRDARPTARTRTPTAAMIEIVPGVRARLRGARETKSCIARDFYIPAMCFSCNLDIFSIMDANYVVCPQCRVVSPLEGGADMEYEGGVGLGFTFQDLMHWQKESLGVGQP